MIPARGRPTTCSKRGKQHCCYGGCKSDGRKLNQEYHFIPFPKPCKEFADQYYKHLLHGHTILHNASSCTLCCKSLRWIHLCNRQDRGLKTLKDITKNTYICSAHFVDKLGPTLLHPDPLPKDISGVEELKRRNVRKLPKKRDSGCLKPHSKKLNLKIDNPKEEAPLVDDVITNYTIGSFPIEENPIPDTCVIPQQQTPSPMVEQENVWKPLKKQNSVCSKPRSKKSNLETDNPKEDAHLVDDIIINYGVGSFPIEENPIPNTCVIPQQQTPSPMVEQENVQRNSLEDLVKQNATTRWLVSYFQMKARFILTDIVDNKLVITIEVDVTKSNDFLHCVLFVLGEQLVGEGVIQRSVKCANSISTLENLLQLLETSKWCHGITNTQLRDTFHKVNTPRCGYFCWQTNSIRAKDCTLLCCGLKCLKCIKYTHSLRSQYNLKKNPKRSESVYCNNRYLPRPKLQSKLNTYKKNLDCAKEKINRLTQKMRSYTSKGNCFSSRDNVELDC